MQTDFRANVPEVATKYKSNRKPCSASTRDVGVSHGSETLNGYRNSFRPSFVNRGGRAYWIIYRDGNFVSKFYDFFRSVRYTADGHLSAFTVPSHFPKTISIPVDFYYCRLTKRNTFGADVAC